MFETNIPESVMKEVDAEVEEMFKDYPKGLGFCHMAWNAKKRLLQQRGYDWKTPAEESPHILYD